MVTHVRKKYPKYVELLESSKNKLTSLEKYGQRV